MTVPLRTSALGSFALVLFAALAAAGTLHAQLPVTPRYALIAGTVFAAVMGVAIAGLRGHHPFDRFGPGNQITAVRAALTALVAGYIGERPGAPVAGAAAATAVVAAALDAVDGWLARSTGLASRFGARFDLEVDALLIMVLSILVWRHDKAGAWILLSGLLRYLFVAAGIAWNWLRRPLPPSRRRKIICVVQIAGLIVALLPAVTPPLSVAVAGGSLAALSYSFVADILWLERHAP